VTHSGMVEFNDPRDVAKAIRMLDGTQLDGRTIGVREYTEDGGGGGGGRREVHLPAPRRHDAAFSTPELGQSGSAVSSQPLATPRVSSELTWTTSHKS
jgi:RNA recognition motif-containing protein